MAENSNHVFSNSEIVDMHLIYDLVYCNSLNAKSLTRSMLPCHKTFSTIHCCLCETRSLQVNKHRKSGCPHLIKNIEFEEDILNEISNNLTKVLANWP